MKLCKDCKHFAPDRSLAFVFSPQSRLRFAKCGRYNVSLVDGKPGSYCSTQRDAYGECGPEGKGWESKE